MAATDHKAHVTETPDVSYIKNINVTHETSDVQVAGVAKFCVALFILMVASGLLMWALFRGFESQTKEAKRSPMALTSKERLPPEPRLQGAPGFGEGLEKTAKTEKTEPPVANASNQPKNPLWEIKALREQWNDVLENGPVDKDGKRYGIPIEQAKEEVLRKGLAVSGKQ